MVKQTDDIHKESRVIDTGKWKINQDLHIIRAHQLYHTSLLDDVRKTIEFHSQTQESSDGFRETGVRERAE